MKSKENLLFWQTTQNLPDVNDEKLAGYLQEIKSVKKDIVQQIKQLQLPALNIAYKSDDIEEINNIAANIRSDFQDVVILGVGGSSLGGKTLVAIKNNPQINIRFLESIDSYSIKNSLEEINLENSCFLVISKSGETIETICQTLIIIEKLKELNISNLERKFIFITQNQDNTITRIAKNLGSRIYYHPQNIGGRFSYLTIVGLLPSALVGLDIKAIRQGARTVIDDFVNQGTENNNVAQICAEQLYLLSEGFNNNVIMPYIDSLKDFTDWYRQLWAESLGKNGFGSTPINSMGTIDQHSQLQLYLDGPRDKFFTFIINKNRSCDFIIKDLPGCSTRFGNKSLNKILVVEQNSTIEVLSDRKFPIRILEINQINESSLSALMMQFFLETIIIAKSKNINPFDQPAVELRKNLAKKYLNK